MTAPGKAQSPFDIYDDSDIRLLIETYPLAWVCAAGGAEASLLPLVGVFDAQDRLITLIGHFARANPLGAALTENSRATILFKGPEGYISPHHAERRDWGPTWNYAQARIQADISVEPELTLQALDMLIEHVERDSESPWRAEELGARYDMLLAMIVGFRAHVTDLKAKFKLGQDERPETLRAILSNLPDDDLARWMRRFNQENLGAC